MGMTEDQLQAKCWMYGWNTYPQVRRIFWAVPNGGSRILAEAVKLQATGVIPGVHDLHLIWAGKFYTFELKVGNNQLTTDRTIITPSGREKVVFGQREFGAKMAEQGGRWFEIRDFETFKRIFDAIMNGKM